MISAFNTGVESLDTPAIPLALSWAQEYLGNLGPLIDLSQAVPNYPAHPELLKSLSEYCSTVEYTGYGEIEGEIELREAYAQHLTGKYQQNLKSSNIHITSGCNQAFIATLITLTNPGESILMSNPCYFNHAATAKILGLNIGYIECSAKSSFMPDLKQLEDSLDAAVKVIALVSPNNPTGAVYSTQLLGDFFSLCQERNAWLVLDETYRDFLPQESHSCHELFAQADWENTFIQLYSFSKSFCIPGHRLGAVTAGTEVISQLAKVMDNLQICAPRAAQMSVARQLPRLEGWIQSNARQIESRGIAFREVMAEFPQWELCSMGAYFAYVKHPWPNLSSEEVVQVMAKKYGILPLPGEFFGNDQSPYLRVAFANADIDTIQLLPERLRAMRNI